MCYGCYAWTTKCVLSRMQVTSENARLVYVCVFTYLWHIQNMCESVHVSCAQLLYIHSEKLCINVQGTGATGILSVSLGLSTVG